MQKFTVHKGVAVPLDSANIDTDQIIPKQFLLAVDRNGFGAHLFHDWRYLDDAETKPNPDFNLNKPEYKGATILVARDNFGNGSSREHAPIAIKAAGVSCVIAETFARIFYRNAINIGLPIIECKEASEKISEGDEVEIDFDSGMIFNKTKGESYKGQAFPEFMQKIIKAEGLINYINQK